MHLTFFSVISLLFVLHFWARNYRLIFEEFIENLNSSLQCTPWEKIRDHSYILQRSELIYSCKITVRFSVANQRLYNQTYLFVCDMLHQQGYLSFPRFGFTSFTGSNPLASIF